MNRSLWCILGVCVAVLTAPLFGDGAGLSGAADCTSSDVLPVKCGSIRNIPCNAMRDTCITDHGDANNTCGQGANLSGCATDPFFCGWALDDILDNTTPPCSPKDLGC